LIGDPAPTLKNVAAWSVAAGAACALLAVLLIVAGSMYLPPRLPWGCIWADWRKKRTLWGLALVLTAIAAYFCGELVFHRVGLRDLYWLTRPGELLNISRLGALSGYFAVLFTAIVASLAGRRVKAPR
jgi:hypothetical protein